MNKQIKRYFDWKFEDSELMSKPYSRDDREIWFGVWSEDVLLVGCPEQDSEMWFSNGPIFSNGPELLNLSSKEFHKKMEEYLKLKYPDAIIGNIY